MLRAALLIALFYGVATWAMRSTVIDPETGLETDEETEPFDPLALIDFGVLDVNDLGNPYVQAFLATIRFGEGTAGAEGYRTMFGGGLFDSFEDHPRTVICRTVGGRRLCSSAAGAYQFLRDTWDRVAGKLNLPDFSPQCQDIAALELIREKGALDDVKAGRFEIAVQKCRKVWASMPGAGYGQPEIAMQRYRAYYASRLQGAGVYA
jgi:lysozyme